MNNINLNTAIENAQQDINDILVDLRNTLATAASIKTTNKRVIKGNSSTKQKAIAMLQEGATTESVVKRFRSLTRGQVSAFKAHVSMGTYS
jgi:hypothetical protein